MASVVQVKPYQRVVAAAALSNLADGIRYVALPLLVLELTSSPFALASVVAANLAPWLLLGLWAGGLTDRVDRKALAKRTALGRVALLALLATLILVDRASVAVVLVAAFVLGASEVLADNVNGALIPSLVEEPDLERANSRVVAAEILGNELIGPAVGALLFATAVSLPFFTNAGLLAIAFLILSGLPLLRQPGIEQSQANETRQRSLEGVSIIRSSPLLRTITWSSALMAAVDGSWFALLALLIVQDLGLAPAALGAFLAIGALGGLIGAWIAGRLLGLSLATVSIASIAATTLALLALAIFPSTAAVAVTLVLTSGAFSLWNVAMVSTRQRASTPQTLGRIAGAHRTVIVLASLGGTLVGGLLAEVFSLRIALATAAIVLVAATPAIVSSFRANSADS